MGYWLLCSLFTLLPLSGRCLVLLYSRFCVRLLLSFFSFDSKLSKLCFLTHHARCIASFMPLIILRQCGLVLPHLSHPIPNPT